MICTRTFTLDVGSTCGAFSNLIWDGGTDLSERDNGGFFVGPGTGTVSGSATGETFNLTAVSPAIVGTAFSNDVQQAFYYWTGTFQYTGPATNCCLNVTFTGSAPVVGVSPAPNGDTHCGFQIIQDGNPVLVSSPVGNGASQVLSLPFSLVDSPTPSTIDVIVQVSAVVRAGFGNASPVMAANIVGSYGSC